MANWIAMPPRRLLWVLIAGLPGLGCDSDPLEEPDAGSSSAVCEEPTGYETAAEPQFVGSVQAHLRDELGDPPVDVLVQVCGLDLCISGETDASGDALVSVGSEMKLPAFKYGDGLRYGKIALLLPPPSDAVALGDVRLPSLPLEGSPITPGSLASSGGAALDVPQGAVVKFDRLTYRSADEQAFRAAEFALDQVPAGLDPGLGLELYFALGPIDTVFCPGVTLSLPNSPGYPAGTEVEFFLHGLDVLERHAPYGGFVKVADGTVSEDGSALVSQDGALHALSLVAVRRKP